MVWENAAHSENHNDVEPCLAEQAAKEVAVPNAQQPNPPSQRCSQPIKSRCVNEGFEYIAGASRIS